MTLKTIYSAVEDVHQKIAHWLLPRFLCQNGSRKEEKTMSKRGKNIYFRKDGRWEGRYIKSRINEKVQYGYVFGKSFEDVECKLEEAITSMTPPTLTNNLTFKELSAGYMISMAPQLKPSSVAKYENILDLYLLPTLGKQLISSIARTDILLLRRNLLISGGTNSTGLAPKTVNSVLSLLKNILEYGSREKGLPIADLGKISVRQSQKPMRILSKMEQQRLSEYLCENQSACNLGILLCLYTGLRIGEICALKWGDVHIDDNYLYVHQTMQRIQRKGSIEKKTEIIIQPPKSDCSIRIIPIPSELSQLLLPEVKEDEAFFLTGCPHVFIEPRCLENKFKSVTMACGIDNLNFHALRHSFATRCVELGFDIKSLSEILGHANVNITLNRYVHPSMSLKQENMNTRTPM